MVFKFKKLISNRNVLSLDWSLNASLEPLAHRLRPRHLDEVIGQHHIIGPGRLLRRAITTDRLTSLIFYGPPGTGKTTLAQVIAEHTQAHFMSLNAVLDGVAKIRQCVEEAKQRQSGLQSRSILFVDEVHRFNKAQQDALLPHVENGTIILIGATTENPFFEVNKALVSRSKLFELRSLEREEMLEVFHRALSHPEGYGALEVTFQDKARDHLIDTSSGDARSLLNSIELAIEPEAKDGPISIDLTMAEESIQKKAVLYDRDGDAHYDTISAFIKSMRGSDPDAALFWMAKMLHAGEDPRFIFRRMIICASEDVGLAAPNVLSQVMACFQAYEVVGLPEGHFPLTQACLLICNAPKSNSTLGFFDALRAVHQGADQHEVPGHLKDGSRDGAELGHGVGYRYPHAFENHWVAQQYLPEGQKGAFFYHPSASGEEGKVKVEIERRRMATWAAMSEEQTPLATAFSQGPGAKDWEQRSIDNASEAMAQMIDGLLKVADLKRDDLVLELGAGSGVLTFRAMESARVGGVHAYVRSIKEKTSIEEQLLGSDSFQHPHLGVYSNPSDLLSELKNIKFDCIFMRTFFESQQESLDLLKNIPKHLSQKAKVILGHFDLHNDQRLSNLLPSNHPVQQEANWIRFKELEDQFFSSGDWFQPESVAKDLSWNAQHHTQTLRVQKQLSAKSILQWLSPSSPLGALIHQEEGEDRRSEITDLLVRHLGDKAFEWKRVFITSILSLNH